MSQDAAPYALVVRFTLREGAEARFDELVARTVRSIRQREPGTLVYACHQVDGAPRQRIFYELYRDQAAFEQHEGQEHTKQFLDQRRALLDSVEVDRLTYTNGKTPAEAGAADA